MSRLGKAELVHGEFADLDESLARVRAVTAEQVRKLAVDLAGPAALARRRRPVRPRPRVRDGRRGRGLMATPTAHATTPTRPATKVAVIGARGRMGRQVCAAVEAADGLELGPRIDVGDDLDALADADVAVVFSVPDVVVEHTLACVGTVCTPSSGRPAGRRGGSDTVRAALAGAPGVGVLVAPNFALGAVLLMRFAAMAAPHFESVEVIELHHPDKVDAPSGTARHTAEMIAAARPDAGMGAGPGRDDDRPGRRPRRRRRRGSGCTPCGCAASSPTRRCSSAGRGSS